MIIANPSSGKKQAKQYAEQVKKSFSAYNRISDIKLTENKEDIARFAKQASEEAYNTLIVIGGDGTVSELANGLHHQKYKPAIGIIPAGTVNNIANGLTIPSNPETVSKDIATYKQKKADVGKINDRLFLSSVSAGPVPETVWEVSDDLKEKYGKAAYFIEGLKSLSDEETYEMELDIDDFSEHIDLNLIIIGVNGSISGIANFFDEAACDDGLLYFFGLKRASISQKITVLKSVLFSKDALSQVEDIAFAIPFKKAAMRIKNSVGYTAVDGEKGASFPIDVEVIPQFFTFLVPSDE